MSCDSIVGAKIVLANASIIEAQGDLLWALKGAGGGNFGVVTELTFKTHVAPDLVSFFQVSWNSSSSTAAVLYSWEMFLFSVFDDKRITPQIVAMADGSVHSTTLFLGSLQELEDLIEPWMRASPTPASRKIFESSWLDSVLFLDSCPNVRLLVFPLFS